MESNEYIFDKIESYLKGKLSKEETAAFEEEIADDTELAELVKKHRFENQALDYFVAKDLKDKLKEWETNPPQAISKKLPARNFQIWRIAGIFLLGGLLATFFWFKYSNTTVPDTNIVNEENTQQDTPALVPSTKIPDSEKQDILTANNEELKEQQPIEPEKKKQVVKENKYQLLAQNIIAGTQISERASLTRKAESGNTENILTAGLRAFLNNQMELAISEFQKIDQSKYPDEYEMIQEYIGQAYLAQHKYNQAAAIFKNIINRKVPSTIDRAEWFLVLSLLPDYPKHKEEVDALLEKMTKPENYHNRAKSAADLKEQLSLL